MEQKIKVIELDEIEIEKDHYNDIYRDGTIIFNKSNHGYIIADGRTPLGRLPYLTYKLPVGKEPKIKFKDKLELNRYLKEWQERLYLNDWIITAELVSYEDLNESESGNVVFDIVNSSAKISILSNDKHVNPITGNVKTPEELILVHELLHIVNNLYCHDDEDYDIYQEKHKKLENMAKSLIMAKYNLSSDWFKIN